MTKLTLITGVFVSGLICSLAAAAAYASEAKDGRTAQSSTAYHKKFQALQQEFRSGPEVTKACLGCHTEAANQMHKSIHWSWQWGKAGGMGKKNSVNNF
jgi:hypothetical protein